MSCNPRYAASSGGFEFFYTVGSVNSYTSIPRGRQEASSKFRYIYHSKTSFSLINFILGIAILK